MKREPWIIAGQGLAGTCLAWSLWDREVPFEIIDRGSGGSSRMAAGLVNPITGKNFEPSWRIGDFLPDVLDFYQKIESRLQRQFWFPIPVLRLAASEKEWRKISGKLDESHVKPWISEVISPPHGWAGAVRVTGGGRLDARGFMEASRDFFAKLGCYRIGDVTQDSERAIWCEGAAGLLAGKYGEARCAKGEILTLRADWQLQEIRVGAGGWIVPIGHGIFKVGANYEWNELNEIPTDAGRQRGEEIATKLGGENFEIIAHEAGIRPILRRSEPLIGPLESGGWMFNALGSKGSLYAPGMARRLAAWLVDGIEPEQEVDFRFFQKA